MKLKIEGKYIHIGIVSFMVIAASIMFFFAFFRMDGLVNTISTFMEILTPFVYGLVMAYLLCPLYNLTFKSMMKKKILYKGKKDRSVFFSKIISSSVSIIAMFMIIAGLLWMVIPGLIESIIGIIKMLPSKINELSLWIESIIDKMPETAGPLKGVMEKIVETSQMIVEEKIIPGSESVITGISTGVFGVISGIKNFSIGVIICVFFLNSKEIFAAQSRKLVFASMNEERAYSFLYGARHVNRTFGKFINGKLIDSLIVGILCFLTMSLFSWPYAMLVSVIIGVTNIIPFFGPFIGAIPSAILIFMVDPLICVYFLIFILILQQLDGNIIGPKILGGSTGLPSFWVMFAILVGGGIFGFVGMVIGIPIFACIYAYIAYGVNRKLERKGLETDINVYKQLATHFDEKIEDMKKEEATDEK